MLLINDHMLESLIESRTHEDLRLHHLASLSVVQNLVAVGMKSQLQHVLAEILHLQMAVGSSITQRSLPHTNLPKDVLHQLRNRHA